MSSLGQIVQKFPSSRDRPPLQRLFDSDNEDQEILGSDLPSYLDSTYHSTTNHVSTMSGSMKRKVVIMGAPSVGQSHVPSGVTLKNACILTRPGKTSLAQQYVAPPTYNEQYFPTIEATSHKTVKYNGVEYDCEIIDSAGQVSPAMRVALATGPAVRQSR